MSRLSLALDQIKLARSYTLNLLNDTKESDWFWMPSEAVTHIAWQAGHLAASQYHLLLARTRGNQPEDASLFPLDQFVRLFGRSSKPMADVSQYPSPSVIRLAMDTIHAKAMAELPTLSEEQLDQPTVAGKPHRIVTTRYSSIIWCAQHEMLHAGQIGLLRRLLGADAQW